MPAAGRHATGNHPCQLSRALERQVGSAGLYGLMAQWHTAPGSFCLETAMATLAGTGAAGPSGDGGNSEAKGTGP